MIIKRFTGALALSGVFLSLCALPSIAVASDSSDRATAAIASAKAKIETGDKMGVSSNAADTQSRARASLEYAQAQMNDHNTPEAYQAAQHSIALADLVIATTTLSGLTDQQNKLRTR
jgi:hypothetical protein